MSSQFKTIGIIGKTIDPGIDQVITGISELLSQKKLKVLLEERTANQTPSLDMESASPEQLAQACNLIIVVGGDGTMLRAARTFCDHGIPMIGVNLGRLGFLADISVNEYQARIEEILNGEYQVEERTLLSATVLHDGKEVTHGDALNDVVVHKLEAAHMIETDTYINDNFVHTHRSDGIITSTATGSTAYALSGGGPIIEPNLEAMVIVPICPHTLSNRPIAIKSDSRVRITMSSTGRNKGQVICDGSLLHELDIGDEVLIQSKPTRLQLLHPKEYDYYQILRAKLHWAEHP